MEDLRHLHPHQVFLRREALTAGYDDRALYGALNAGLIVRVRHGAYVGAQVWNEADEAERHRLRGHAVGLVHEGLFALSHKTGALVHGVRTWGTDLTKIDVSRALTAVGRRHSDVSYHREAIDRAMLVEGTPTLPAAACLIGAASRASIEAGVVLIDSAYHLGVCSPESLRDELGRRRQWPGTARLQITLRLAQQGAQSVAESRMRYLFWREGIPKAELQYPVYDAAGQLIGNADFGWPEYGVLGEFDGRVKYEQFLREGERASDAVVREKLREDRMREATGWRFIRFVWSDLNQPARTAERVRRVLQATRR